MFLFIVDDLTYTFNLNLRILFLFPFFTFVSDYRQIQNIICFGYFYLDNLFQYFHLFLELKLIFHILMIFMDLITFKIAYLTFSLHPFHSDLKY